MKCVLTSDQHLGTGTLVDEGWGISVNWSELVGGNWTTLIDWLTNHIDDSSESLWTDWHQNWGTGVLNWLTTDETLSGVQSNGSDVVTTQVLSDLEHESVGDTLDFKSVENWGKSSLELHVDDGTNDLGNLAVSDLSAEVTYIHQQVSFLWLRKKRVRWTYGMRKVSKACLNEILLN